MSIGFELLEYSLEHQLPNFAECWWDHWILDVVVCNGLGIYLGMKTCEYFSMKPYNWRGLWNIPTFKGKIKRIVTQFSPYNWIEYDWRPTSSLKRWLYMIVLVILFFIAELGTFYLKFVLWIPPPHFLCLGRLIFMWLVGAVAMRESFEYLDNSYFIFVYFIYEKHNFNVIHLDYAKEWELKHGSALQFFLQKH